MSKQDPRPRQPEAETEKKKPETVLLSAEELRAISGGSIQPVSGPKPGSDTKLKGTGG